jgi:hypothetical protein
VCVCVCERSARLTAFGKGEGIEIGLECARPQKMFPHLKLLTLLFMGPTFGFDVVLTHNKETVFDLILCFFLQ